MPAVRVTAIADESPAFPASGYAAAHSGEPLAHRGGPFYHSRRS